MCDKCSNWIQKSNFSKHYSACGTTKKPSFKCDSWFDGAHWKCPNCDFIGKTRQSTTSHFYRLHTNPTINFNPATKKNGRHKSWNKGLTKETDNRVARNAQAVSIATKGRTGWPQTEENKRKTSIRMSLKNPGGKSKWYEVAGQKVQGRWERDIALKLEELGIRWYKPKVHRDVWLYNLNDKTKSYTPDIYLIDLNIYLEIKGYWWGNDREKMNAVLEQHADKKLLIIEKHEYENIKQGILPW